eukprot:6186939-Pleurochrysis_carterae.AAC.2
MLPPCVKARAAPSHRHRWQLALWIVERTESQSPSLLTIPFFAFLAVLASLPPFGALPPFCALPPY